MENIKKKIKFNVIDKVWGKISKDISIRADVRVEHGLCREVHQSVITDVCENVIRQKILLK